MPYITHKYSLFAIIPSLRSLLCTIIFPVHMHNIFIYIIVFPIFLLFAPLLYCAVFILFLFWFLCQCSCFFFVVSFCPASSVRFAFFWFFFIFIFFVYNCISFCFSLFCYNVLFTAYIR